MTLVTLVSRICMKATTMTVTVMAHLRAGETGGASGAGEVMAGPTSLWDRGGSSALSSNAASVIHARHWVNLLRHTDSALASQLRCSARKATLRAGRQADQLSPHLGLPPSARTATYTHVRLGLPARSRV